MEEKSKNLSPEEAAQLELNTNELNKVTGAGDPFGDVPRVPENPIDDDLRKNG